MVTKSRTPAAEPPEVVRRKAGRLLNELLIHRDQIEARLAEFGRVDPIKCVTGTSSMERAILSTRQLIQEMDTLVDQFNQEVHQLSRVPSAKSA